MPTGSPWVRDTSLSGTKSCFPIVFVIDRFHCNEHTASAWSMRSKRQLCSKSFFWLVCNCYTAPSEKVIFLTSENLFKKSSLILISTYCYSDRSSSWARASLLQAVCQQMTSTTATIHNKPVTSLSGNDMLAYSKQSRDYTQISQYYPIFMACTRGGLILVTYPDTVWTIQVTVNLDYEVLNRYCQPMQAMHDSV